LCVVVDVPLEVVLGVALVVASLFVVEEEDEELPQPATAIVLARTARAVSMAASGVLLIGRAPIVARGQERSPYQGHLAPSAVG
jgi:uncharacterized membrane protein